MSLGDAQALVKIQQVDAAAHQHVLAVVDGFRAGLIGSGAAAEKRAGFQEPDAVTFAAQRGSRGKSGQSAADNDNVHRRASTGAKSRQARARAGGFHRRRHRR